MDTGTELVQLERCRPLMNDDDSGNEHLDSLRDGDRVVEVFEVDSRELRRLPVPQRRWADDG